MDRILTLLNSKPLQLRISDNLESRSIYRLPLLIRVAAILTLSFLIPITLIYSQPVDNSALKAFLQPSVDCLNPCFMGIQPGSTLGSEAIALLEQHAWVTNIQIETYSVSPTYGKVIWDWTADTPEFINHTQSGSLSLLRQDSSADSALVESIAIPTTIRLHQAQQTLGEPDFSSAGTRMNNLAYGLTYNGDSAQMILTGEIPCPANWLTYWESRATLYLTIWAGPDQFVQPQTVIDMC